MKICFEKNRVEFFNSYRGTSALKNFILVNDLMHPGNLFGEIKLVDFFS